MNFTLSPERRRALCRRFGTRAMVIASALEGSWMHIPDELRQDIPKDAVTGIALAMFIIGFAGRILGSK